MPPDQTCAHFTHVTRVIFEAQTQVRMCFTLQLSLCARCCLYALRFLLRARLFSCMDTQDFMRTAL